ncbi:tRNA (adenosine(37)-N6)-threonylcarbamoyltransferase complex transferase subunit TsaD, partial [Candidatus Gottesmanbacteria bacterium]|nr:tRNA (adenosine(37)-N6)-threonylcarbamoyltransferase complex transferase subunit TsaD [Candidatus Gottesmanbacteria bacterium]
MKILAIETSCDETAAAVVEDLPAGRQVELKILSNIVASSTAMHEKYGGIVPEVAAREQLKCIIPVITEALSGLDLHKDIDAIAVTVGPGLIGSLLVGVETAKTLAFVTDKPIIPVNHVIAHMYANFVRDESSVVSRQSSDLKMNRLKAEDGRLIAFPAISLVVSGGHTELYLMKSVKELQWLGGTLDDAAGECFDKTARLLGFGHGGGLAIEKAASKKSDGKIKLPRPMMDESFNFSFSGLKTAVMREWKKLNNPELASAFAHEIQESITDVLV